MSHVGPRMIGEEERLKQLPVINKGSLRDGDILIAKVFTGPSQSTASENMVRVGQLLASHVYGGSSYSEHTAMVGTMGGLFHVYQALTTGVNRSKDTPPGRPHAVYRCSDTVLGQKAAEIAIGLAGWDATKLKLGNIPYPSKGGLVRTVFRCKYAGAGARERIRLLKDAWEKDKTPLDVALNCAEFVVSCYEVAALVLNRGGLNVDPRAMTVKAMEAVLGRSPNFTLIGNYTAT